MGIERIYTVMRDVRLRQMFVRSFAVRDRHPFAAFTEVIAICSPCFIEGSLSVHSQRGITVCHVRREVAIRSQKDIRLHLSLVSLKGSPIAHFQKDVRLQEGKNLFANKVLPKKSLGT